MKKLLVLASLLVSSLAFGQGIERTPAPENAELYIVSPLDGAVIEGDVTVVFGLKNMGVAPAGVDRESTGHHHLLIDKEELPAPDVPMGGDVKHFGGGQTQTTIALPPGKHTLQLILGDMYHVPHDPIVVSEKITITVLE